jgi:hypothetical protein
MTPLFLGDIMSHMITMCVLSSKQDETEFALKVILLYLWTIRHRNFRLHFPGNKVHLTSQKIVKSWKPQFLPEGIHEGSPEGFLWHGSTTWFGLCTQSFSWHPSSSYSLASLATAYYHTLLLSLSLLSLYSRHHTYDFSPLLTSLSMQLALFRSQLRYYFLCSHWLCQSPFTDNGCSSTGSLTVPLRIWLACIGAECPWYAPFVLLATCFCPILAWLTLQPWRWRRYTAPKHWALHELVLQPRRPYFSQKTLPLLQA